MAISHAGHNHPATPAARAACRKSTGNPNVTRIESDGLVKTNADRRGLVKTNADRRGLARTAGRNAQLAAKIRLQPRKSGARVSAGTSTCVQAALHKGNGRCACGWHTEGYCIGTCSHEGN
jgi:hypothetical protein